MKILKFRIWDGHTMRHMTLQEMIDEQVDLNGKKIMQFTGLCDRRKKEIYEGDIIRENGVLNVMKYRTPSFILMYKEPFMPSDDSKKDTWQIWPNWSGNVEVIGNTCENENLLQ